MSFASAEKLKFGQGHLIHCYADRVMVTIPLSILNEIGSLIDDFILEGFDEMDDYDAVKKDVERNKEALQNLCLKVGNLLDEAEDFDERNKLSELVKFTPKKANSTSVQDSFYLEAAQESKTIIDTIFDNPFQKNKGGMIPPCQ